MEGFWTSAVKYCGIAAVAGFVGYSVYPQIIASPYLKNLTHTELFALLGLIVIVVFGLCLALINAGAKRSLGNNTVNIKGSKVHGSVRAGNNTTRENK
jgi:ABC-type sugar transport system permease subunit